MGNENYRKHIMLNLDNPKLRNFVKKKNKRGELANFITSLMKDYLDGNMINLREIAYDDLCIAKIIKNNPDLLKKLLQDYLNDKLVNIGELSEKASKEFSTCINKEQLVTMLIEKYYSCEQTKNIQSDFIANQKFNLNEKNQDNTTNTIYEKEVPEDLEPNYENEEVTSKISEEQEDSEKVNFVNKESKIESSQEEYLNKNETKEEQDPFSTVGLNSDNVRLSEDKLNLARQRFRKNR